MHDFSRVGVVAPWHNVDTVRQRFSVSDKQAKRRARLGIRDRNLLLADVRDCTFSGP